jgi:hypothetical protein
MKTSRERAIDSFDLGVAEDDRRRAALDSLLGDRFDKDASGLLSDISFDLLCYLLDHTQSVAAAQALLIEHEPRSGYRTVTPVTDDVALAVPILNGIRSAVACKKAEYARLILGPVEVRLRESRRKGGKKAAESKQKEAMGEWQARALAHRDQLLRTGEDPLSVASVVADRFRKSPSAVRRLFAKKRARS